MPQSPCPYSVLPSPSYCPTSQDCRLMPFRTFQSFLLNFNEGLEISRVLLEIGSDSQRQ